MASFNARRRTVICILLRFYCSQLLFDCQSVVGNFQTSAIVLVFLVFTTGKRIVSFVAVKSLSHITINDHVQ